MKLKSVLLASVAVLFAGSASAADLTNPFFVPSQGKMTSDTKVQHSRTHWSDANGGGERESGIEDATYASEELAYGITNNLAVFGIIGNHFDNEGELNNSHNFEYEIGAKYNHNFGNIKTQVAGSYYTYNPKSFEGHNYGGYWNGDPESDYDKGDGTDENESRWQKFLKGEVKLGYDMGCGLMPYASYSFTGQIDNANREFLQSAFMGVHKYAVKWAADAGIRYDFNTDGHNNNLVYAQAEFDYYPMDNLAVGVYGDYKIGGATVDSGSENDEIGTDYTVGLRAKVMF